MDSSSTKNHSINGALGGRFIFFVALCAWLVSSPSAIAERIFNVQDYGATGDGITDDTQPIRDAIADAGAWADANTPEIATIYFPAGEYAVAPRTTDPQWSIIYAPAVFVVPTSNLKFLGDGHTQTKISCYTAGMKDPETHWTVTDNSYSKIQRGGAFAFARKTSLKNITFDGLRISGNADATGNADVGGEFRKVSVQAGRIVPSFALDWVNGTRVKFGQAQVALPAAIDPESYYYIVGSDGNAFGISETPDGSPVDLSGASSDEVFKIFNGDGWDMTHKAIFLQAGAWENIVVENCHLDRWRGEIIHGGGDAPRTLVVRNSILEHANSSVISVPSLILEDSIIRYGYNGIENYGRQSWHTSEIRRCQFIATPDRRFGETNAVVFIGMPTANAVFEDNTFINYKRGVLLSQLTTLRFAEMISWMCLPLSISFALFCILRTLPGSIILQYTTIIFGQQMEVEMLYTANSAASPIETSKSMTMFCTRERSQGRGNASFKNFVGPQRRSVKDTRYPEI
jgi:hypothetical protein